MEVENLQWCKSLYFDKDVTSGEVFIKQYENGEKNVLEESSQQKDI